jgi:Tol biopolymer transport system component
VPNARARLLPSWSPDGRWIAFGLKAENDGGGSIMIVPSSGGAARYVTDGRASDNESTLGDAPDDCEPDWSPDGTRLAFTRIVWLSGYSDQQEIFSVRADGSDTEWITTDTSYEADRPSWSPSGGRIVVERASPGGVAIFTAAGQLRRVLDPFGTEPAWQRLK